MRRSKINSLLALFRRHDGSLAARVTPLDDDMRRDFWRLPGSLVRPDGRGWALLPKGEAVVRGLP